MNNLKREPSGIGGWLLLLVINLSAIAPLASIGLLFGEIAKEERAYPQLLNLDKWASYKTITWCYTAVIIALCIYAGIILVRSKTWVSVQRSIIIFWIVWPFSDIFQVSLLTFLFGNNFITAHTVGTFIGSILAATIWTAYLLKSIRVRNTYGEPEMHQDNKNVQAPKLNPVITSMDPVKFEGSPKKSKQQPPVKQEDSSMSKDDSNTIPQDISSIEQKILALESLEAPVDLPLNIDDDIVYEKAFKEIEDKKVHKASWARAFSETEGDEKKTKALYIKLRVANMKKVLRQKEEKKLDDERRIRKLREKKLRRLETIKKTKSLTESKEQLINSLGEKWENLVRKYEKILAVDHLEDYLYDIAEISLYGRTHYANWLMHAKIDWIRKNVEKGPNDRLLGHYGIILIFALERGIDIQSAKEWGRPSRFKVLNAPGNDVK
ncbi:MAG: DUF2569 family protein [Deltaproteobacteria bacterium]|nr:DUF2569 family protein [Candidatus Tharpella aukensis]